MRDLRRIAAVMALALAPCGAACGSTHSTPGPPQTAATVWLCRPGLAHDPCAGDLTATVVPASGARTTHSAVAASSAPFDCFYIYPTVSGETSANADLAVQPAETNVAIAQAARFSPLCNVWAPMYRQQTVFSLFKGLGADPNARTVAYNSLLSAWNDYLKNDNDGRPIVFIGHSQGAAMLIRLLSSRVDPNPSIRSRVVVAIIAGGNVVVPIGKTVGASFQHLPLCTTAKQTGCVIAYSTFPSQPPAAAYFGRPGQGVSAQSGQSQTSGVQVACVNPAALGGGTANLAPYFTPSSVGLRLGEVSTSWVTFPDLYSATCRSGDGATWLQVDRVAAARDTRPAVTETLGPLWGYHVVDINLALGNLVADVAGEETAFAAAHG